MTELLLLRHAHAGDPMAWTKSDDVRPLSKKGRDQAARMATFLAAAGVRPDVIVSSPKTRAMQTATPVADELGLKVRIGRAPGGAVRPGRDRVPARRSGRPGATDARGPRSRLHVARRGPLPRAIGASAQGSPGAHRCAAAAVSRLRHAALAAAAGAAATALGPVALERAPGRARQAGPAAVRPANASLCPRSIGLPRLAGVSSRASRARRSTAAGASA